MSEQSPTVFGGRYELRRRLARGGMADVFLAQDQLLGRPVAVKVLFPEFAADPKFVERFRREAQSAANLNHPNIVSIYDWGEETGTYYIVMEYVEGQSLAQILRRDGRLSAEQVTRVALDVSSALGFAHDGDVVHRDVKPGNVLVSPKGEMKVADFGIATALTSTADSNLTQTGAVMGTATYFSPEQAQGLKVDNRSDLYSLGVVMYEMLVGHPPFSGETPVSIAYKHVQEPVPPVSDQGVDVPGPLAAICMKLLSKDPANRYRTAAALRSDLDRFRQGQALVASNRAVAMQAGPPTTAMPAQQAHGTRALPQTYSEPPRRRGGLIFVGVLTLLLILAGFLILAQSFLEGEGAGNDPETPTVEAIAEVAIPAVAGRPDVDARNTLSAQGFVVETRAIADDRVGVGLVITTEPASGVVVPEGSTVTIVVSSGRNAQVVPRVLTLSENEALQVLADSGFRVTIDRVESNSAPEGEVIAQSPDAQSLLTAGETVTIQVSAGSEDVEIPDLRGFDLSEAQVTLEASGFVVDAQFVLQFDDEIPQNFVVATNPPAGSSVDQGATVQLILSDGPEGLFLPSVFGIDRFAARSQLEAVGLVVQEVAVTVVNPVDVGLVVDMIPVPGTLVQPGNVVQLFVAVGQAPGGPTTVVPAEPTVDPALGGQGPGNGQGNGTGNSGFETN